MFQKKKSLIVNQHIINVDIIQKYSLKNINEMPEIREIALTANTDIFSNFTNVSEEFTQNYSFFILSSVTSMFPYIYMIKNNVLQTNKKFCLKFVLRNKSDINLFIENFSTYLLEEDTKKIKVVTNEFNLKTFIPFKKDLDVNIQKTTIISCIELSFKFNNRLLKKKNFYKKYPPFWLL